MRRAMKDRRQPRHAPMMSRAAGATVAPQRSQCAMTGQRPAAAAAAMTCRAQTPWVDVQSSVPRQAPRQRHKVHRPTDHAVMLTHYRNGVSAQLMVLLTSVAWLDVLT